MSARPHRRCHSTHPHIPPDRVQKLKDARTQAAKEIEEYKKSKEQEFKAFEQSVRPVAIHDLIRFSARSDLPLSK